MQNCTWCGFETKNAKFCSLSCGAKHQHSIAPKPIKIFKNTCPVCSTKHNNKIYCSHSCSAKATNKQKKKIKDKYCKQCERLITGNQNNIYCNTECHKESQYQEIIKKWLNNETTGLSTNGTVTNPIKRWLRETRGNACEICGWAEINPTTGVVPIVADHIDGRWQNNRPENLRLLCPNHDSLQSTYKALNKGNGRSNRQPHVRLEL